MILNEETYHLLRVGDRIHRIDPYLMNAIVTMVYSGSDTSSFKYETGGVGENITDFSWLLTHPPFDVWKWICPPIHRENSWINIWEGDNGQSSLGKDS